MLIVSDLVFMYSEGSGRLARIYRGGLEVLALPMVCSTLLTAFVVDNFSGFVSFSVFFMGGLLGLALVQADKRHGVNPKYLDGEAEEEHENHVQFFFGVIAIGYMMFLLLTKYAYAVYPYIPAGFGGAGTSDVTLSIADREVAGKIIQESERWIVYVDTKTDSVVRVRAAEVKSIVQIRKK